MELLEILQKNGTGFLEGNYQIDLSSVSSIEKNDKENYIGKYFDISLSLQDKNIDQLRFKLESILIDRRIVFSREVKVSVFDHKIKLLCTEHSIFSRFGKFQAFLIPKFGDQNSFFK